MGSNLPPQRTRPGGIAGSRDQRRSISPTQGAEEAAKRLGLTCFHAGQKVAGHVACAACQFQIRNRGILPACPECGELIWAWLDTAPPPEIEGAGTAPEGGAAAGEGSEAPAEEAPVAVQENVSIEPT